MARRFTADKVETYSDLILGLPGETYESFRNGVDKLIRLGQHNRIQFNNLTILPNAEMGNPDYLKKFEMVTVAVRDHQHPRRRARNCPTTFPRSRTGDRHLFPAAGGLAAHARVCLDGGVPALRQAVAMPMMVAHARSAGCPIATSSRISWAHPEEYPVIAACDEFFEREALSMQQGGPEYVYSKEWLGIYWPADEYAFIKLTSENKLAAFYEEAGRLLPGMIKQSWPLLEGRGARGHHAQCRSDLAAVRP